MLVTLQVPPYNLGDGIMEVVKFYQVLLKGVLAKLICFLLVLWTFEMATSNQVVPIEPDPVDHLEGILDQILYGEDSNLNPILLGAHLPHEWFTWFKMRMDINDQEQWIGVDCETFFAMCSEDLEIFEMLGVDAIEFELDTVTVKSDILAVARKILTKEDSGGK